MRVLVYAADTARCGYRLIWPARTLASFGCDVDVLTKDDPPPSSEPRRWQGWDELDVVVFQRPLQRRWLGSIERFKQCGVTVVVDIDDDFHSLPPGNAVWQGVHPANSRDCNPQILAEACRRADWVTVTTKALARRYGSHGRVSIVPNHVPASYFDVVRERHDGVWVGWTGAVASHPGDLDVTRGGVARAARDAGAMLRVVGPGDGVARALSVDRVEATGYVPLGRYPYEMARFDVGIVPLARTAFNDAKSYLKGLEFAALGVPFVASPTEPYRELQARGVGELASRGRDWYAKVRLLAGSADARAELAGRGRVWVRTQTVEANVDQWWDAWTKARERSSRKVPA